MKIATASEARHIARTLGTRRAAGYLRNNHVPLSVALYWLAGIRATWRLFDSED